MAVSVAGFWVPWHSLLVPINSLHLNLLNLNDLSQILLPARTLNDTTVTFPFLHYQTICAQFPKPDIFHYLPCSCIFYCPLQRTIQELRTFLYLHIHHRALPHPTPLHILIKNDTFPDGTSFLTASLWGTDHCFTPDSCSPQLFVNGYPTTLI